MIKSILFDFDGTIADTAEGIVKTMEQTFLEIGVSVPCAADMRATIGLPLKDALQMLGALSDEQALVATKTYHRLFPMYEAKFVTIFPKVKETLEKLQDSGIRMAICTSRDNESLRLICDPRGIVPFFETAITASDGIKAKPAPDMVNALLERINLTREEVIVVGDTTFDIEMGNNAGCRTIAVTYGNHSRSTLEGAHPTHIIDRFDDLIEVLRL